MACKKSWTHTQNFSQNAIVRGKSCVQERIRCGVLCYSADKGENCVANAQWFRYFNPFLATVSPPSRTSWQVCRGFSSKVADLIFLLLSR